MGLLTAKDLSGVDKKQLFYRAVVEDDQDPLKQGRVRVRILGMHPDDKSAVPTKTLPWAEVMIDNKLGLIAGIGNSAVPLPGSWCWIFFDNGDYNYPVIMGLINGRTVKSSTDGFGSADGDKIAGTKIKEFESLGANPVDGGAIGESDINRLARNDSAKNLDKTISKKQTDNADKADGEFDAPTASRQSPASPPDDWIGTPPTPPTGGDIELPTDHEYAKYTYNTVEETRSGHHYICDDTPGNERLMWYHKSGTYKHMRYDGSVMERTVSAKHEVIDTELQTHIKDFKQMVVEGYEKRHVKKYRETIIDENDTKTVGKNYTRKIGKNDVKDVGSKGIHKFGGLYTIVAPKILMN
jgi:hypothetical protein